MAEPFFFLKKDADFLQGIMAEVADLFLREVELRLINRTRTQVESLYTESKNIKYDSFICRAQVELTPKKAKLTKFGLDENRELIVYIEAAVLIRDGIRTPSQGDVIVVEGEQYEILDEQKVGYFGHQENSFTYLFACNRLRDRSINDEQLVDANNPAGEVEVPHYVKDNDYPGEE